MPTLSTGGTTTATFAIDAWGTILVSSARGVGTLTFNSDADNLRSDFAANLQSKTYGPWGAPGTVTLAVTSGSIDYTVTLGYPSFATVALQGGAALDYVAGIDASVATPGVTVLGAAWYSKITYTGAGNVTGAGHLIAALNHTIINAPTRTVALALGSEGVMEVTAGTVTNAIGAGGVLNDVASGATVNEFNGQTGQINANHGTITTFNAVKLFVTANSGTIGTANGLKFPDISGISGITTKQLFSCDDYNAPGVSLSSLNDASIFVYNGGGDPNTAGPVPTNGGTSTVPDKRSLQVLVPGGTIATHTLLLPASPTNGQSITFVMLVGAITACTFNFNGKSSYCFPSPGFAFATDKRLSMVYSSAVSAWVCTGYNY